MKPDAPAGTRWWSVVAIVATLGFLLRYHDISHQVVLDDEWHALRRASGETALGLVTHYFARATAIPLNVYERLALDTVGWSEISVRLLSILATAATLIAFPSIVYRVFESRVMGVAAAVVLAASPFWIFYAQSARPYAAYLLFLISTFYYFERAVRSNAGLKPWVPFAACGALAAYFHLFAVPAVASLAVVPLVAARSRPRSELRALLIPAIGGFALWTFFLAVLYAVPLLNGKVKDLPVGHPPPDFTSAFWENSAELLTGSRYTVVAWLLVLASVVGLVHAFRTNRIFTGALLAAAAGQLAAVFIAQPREFYVPLVMLRYCVTLHVAYFTGLCAFVQLACTFAASGAGDSRRPVVDRYLPFAGALCSVLLVCATPIPRALSTRPNNFRLHSAFQERYGNWDSSKMYKSLFYERRQRTGIPDFYAPLERAGKPCRLVEYPLEIGDDVNPFYLYQYHHGCEVLAGYSASTDIGVALHAKQGEDKVRFNQLIAVDDVSRLRATGADGVVVHLDLMNEVQGKRPGRPSRETTRVLSLLEKEFGPPTYVDRWLRVFSPRR